MGNRSTAFTYRTYVGTTPEVVWRALTEPALTVRYWRHRVAGGKTLPSDWRPGSTWDLVHPDVGLVVHDPAQVVLEAERPRRLAYTWHTFTPQWAACVGLPEEQAAVWRSEPRSKVAFDIEDTGKGVVSLTVVHDGFPPESAVLEGVSEGWPAVLSSLKSLLETGAAL